MHETANEMAKLQATANGISAPRGPQPRRATWRPAPRLDWEREVSYYRLEPHWMTVYAPDVARLLES